MEARSRSLFCLVISRLKPPSEEKSDKIPFVSFKSNTMNQVTANFVQLNQ